VTAMAVERRPRPVERPRRPRPVARAEVIESRERITRQRQRTFRRAVPSQKVHRGNYQAVVLAEFVAAILLVAAAPIATKQTQSPGKSGGTSPLSPYGATEMVQLGALTIAYLILALLSVGGQTTARFSAWFGGLLLLGVGLAEAASIAKTIDVFGTAAPGPAPATPAAATSGGPQNTGAAPTATGA
jgi:hypothetical protein